MHYMVCAKSTYLLNLIGQFHINHGNNDGQNSIGSYSHDSNMGERTIVSMGEGGTVIFGGNIEVRKN